MRLRQLVYLNAHRQLRRFSSALLKRERLELSSDVAHNQTWMDAKEPYAESFFKVYGTQLFLEGTKSAHYYTMPSNLHDQLQLATTQLHWMFTEATRVVIANPFLWPSFGFPDAAWPRAFKSFHRGEPTIFGRLDFALSVADRTLKCYEYNSDSSACLMECGEVQHKWSRAVGRFSFFLSFALALAHCFSLCLQVSITLGVILDSISWIDSSNPFALSPCR